MELKFPLYLFLNQYNQSHKVLLGIFCDKGNVIPDLLLIFAMNKGAPS